jgi:hypothetical protein
MSNGTIRRRQRSKLATHRTDSGHAPPACTSAPPRCVVAARTPRPMCQGCGKMQVLVTCRCHPVTGRGWQCPDAPLRPNMVLVPLPPADDFADLAEPADRSTTTAPPTL